MIDVIKNVLTLDILVPYILYIYIYIYKRRTIFLLKGFLSGESQMGG